MTFKLNIIKTFTKTVEAVDAATFESGSVHPVYSTFALSRDAEWVCRLFVIDMKREDEEGIGTFIKVEHVSPALVGSEVVFKAIISEHKANHVICDFEAKVNDRLIAKGQTGQKILKKEWLEALFASIK